MQVSNNSILNILLPNDNKVLKEVLKEADTKTLENIKNGDKNVSDILKNLFGDLKSGNKTSATIETILKNSNVFKDLGNFSNSLKSLLDSVKNDPSLTKFKSTIENLLKNIDSLDDKTLKEMINKSGVFHEAKLLNSSLQSGKPTQDLDQLLNQIKTLLKNIPSIEAKNVETLIDKILQNSNQSTTSQTSTAQNSADLKSLITLLQNLSKNIPDKQVANLTNLTNQLKNISSDAQLVESKIQNLGQTQTTSPEINETKSEVLAKTKVLLFQLKNELLANKGVENSQNLIKQIDNLLLKNDLFTKSNEQIEPKQLLNQLTNLDEIKAAIKQNPNLSNIINNLKNLTSEISTLENKTLSNNNITQEKTQLTQNIKESLTNLKNELLATKTIDSKLANQIIDKLLNIQNLFSKIELPSQLQTLQQTLQNQGGNFQSLFSSNIDNLIVNLKEAIINSSTNPTNLNLQQTVLKTIDKLESLINNLNPNANQNNPKQNIQNSLQNDMKTVLLQMQEELSAKTDPKSAETLKHVDKMVTQIEYFQLLSVSSNSNSVYIPFLWDMLEDGNISMKKLQEDRFYCEINLSLKEFGETQLLLSMYDKNKLDLTVYASKESFKQSIKEHFSKLRVALNSAGLIPVNIKIIDLKKEEEKTTQNKPQDIYNNQSINSSLGFGLDIKV